MVRRVALIKVPMYQTKKSYKKAKFLENFVGNLRKN